ncbi:MAG: beta-glucuronidase [Clostridia bacterium]|nr:beta-glucuronidase [Clostridia bacterium]
MAHNLTLVNSGLKKLRDINPRLMSYNVEMTEVTGGTFWKAYTEGQIAGTEDFPKLDGFTNHTAMAGLMQYYPPIDTTNEKLISLAKELGPVWVRVSGTWATKTYYDFDGTTGGKAPEGYQSVLTRQQWENIIGFVKTIGAKLLVSASNCAGDHKDGGPLDLTQIKKLFALTDELGGSIDAFEFMNEPNMLQTSGAPAGYDFPDYVRDQDIANRWVRENYPECLIVGPCNTGMTDEEEGNDAVGPMGAGMGNMMKLGTVHDLMRGAEVPMDVYSYHYYNGISERLMSVMPAGHWPAEAAHTDAYLQVAPGICYNNLKPRDKYVPGGEMWVTESGDAGGGGDTWASTYLDVLRTLNELGSFCTLTNGVIFHNTLASSDYGFLQHGTFDPRPNYFAVLLWTRIMGNAAYACDNPNVEGAHVYCHSRKDGKDGYAYLIVNNSLTDHTTLDLPGEATLYELSGNGNMRSKVMYLNGDPLTIGEGNALPSLDGKCVSGKVEIAPGSCAFVVV